MFVLKPLNVPIFSILNDFVLPIGLLFAYAYRFSPLIERGFKLATSAGWINLQSSGL